MAESIERLDAQQIVDDGDDVDDFDDDQADEQPQQPQQQQGEDGGEQFHGDEQEHDGGELGADGGGSFMRLNLNGQHMEGTIGAPFDEHPGSSGNDAGDSRSVAAAAADDEFPVFKVGECVARSRQVMSCVKCDVSNGHVYIGSYTGEVVLFDFAAGREVWRRQVSVEGKPVSITCLDIHQTQLAIGCSDGATLIFDLESFQVTQCWLDHRQRVSAIAWVNLPSHAEYGLVYTTSHDGYFLVRDPSPERNGKILHSFITCTCPLSALIVESPNVVYTGSWDGQVKRIDLERKVVSLVLKVNTIKESPIRCFALAPSPLPAGKPKKKAVNADGEPVVDEALPIYILIIAHGIGEIKSWDMRNGRVSVSSYHGSTDVTNYMTYWNSRLFVGGDDRFVRVFDVYTGQQLEILMGHEGGITGLAIAGQTPVVPEHIEGEDPSVTSPSAAAAAAAAASATNRSSSRGGGPKSSSSASAGPPQQGVGNELLMTTGFDCQARSYKIAAIEAAIQMRLANAEQAKTAAFEFFLEDKKAKALLTGGSGKKKKGAKGSAKGKKKGGSAKADGASASKTGSASGSNKGSKSASKAGSKAASARGTAEPKK